MKLSLRHEVTGESEDQKKNWGVGGRKHRKKERKMKGIRKIAGIKMTLDK